MINLGNDQFSGGFLVSRRSKNVFNLIVISSSPRRHLLLPRVQAKQRRVPLHRRDQGQTHRRSSDRTHSQGARAHTQPTPTTPTPRQALCRLDPPRLQQAAPLRLPHPGARLQLALARLRQGARPPRRPRLRRLRGTNKVLRNLFVYLSQEPIVRDVYLKSICI